MRKPSLSLISFITPFAIFARLGSSESPLMKASAWSMDRAQSSEMFLPPIRTARLSGLSLVPLHVGQGLMSMKRSISSRTE